jgi:3-mercaptopyruvate sulfurtransferase SseA
MGMNNVCHMSGGFTAWKEAEQPIEPVEKKA